jgi:hypothetical protein
MTMAPRNQTATRHPQIRTTTERTHAHHDGGNVNGGEGEGEGEGGQQGVGEKDGE